jgi:hypothetical protein
LCRGHILKIQNPSILIYGDFRSDRLAASYQRAFTQLGYAVTPFCTEKIDKYLAPWLAHRAGHRATIRSINFRRLGSFRWNRYFLSSVKQARPDLVFITNGDFLMPETLEQIRVLGIRVFIFHADNPFPGNSASRPEALPCALESDCYFIWSRYWCQRLQGIGVKRANYLGFAWDEELFPYVELSEEPEHDVVFIGGWDEDREAALTPIAARFKLRIWGPPYWIERTQPNSPLRHCWQGRALRGAEVSEVMAKSKIVLNSLRRQNLPDGVIMRTYEVPGCGGFMLSTRTEGAEREFPEGIAGAYFDSVQDCNARIEYFLHNDQVRRDIAREAHETVKREHRYINRAQTIIEAFRDII